MADPEHPVTDLLHTGDDPEITYDPQDAWIAFRLCIGGQDFILDPDKLRVLAAEANRALDFT